MNIKSSAFTIKPIGLKDASLFFNLVNSNKSRLEDHLPITVKNCKTEQMTHQYINKSVQDRRRKIFYLFCIWKENDLIGSIMIRNVDWSVPQCELAYFISREEEGKGIIAEAVRTISRFCYDRLNMKRIGIRIASSNKKSQLVAERSGFQKLEWLDETIQATTDGELIYFQFSPSN